MKENPNWISLAYQEAENSAAIRSAKEAARLEKCGCLQCRQQISQIYKSWNEYRKNYLSTS